MLALIGSVLIDAAGRLPSLALLTTGSVVVYARGDSCGGERVAVLPAGYRLSVRRVGYGKACIFYEVALPGGGRGFVTGNSPIEIERLVAARRSP